MKYSHSLINALILIFVTLASNASRANSATNELPILDYSKIEQYSGDELYEYHKALFNLMAAIEKFQGNSAAHKKEAAAYLFRLIEESHAQTETTPPYSLGNNCLIGGYWGTFIKTETKSMTCDSPNRCTTSSGKSGHVCNPLFFTYQDTSAKSAFCAPLVRDLTTTGCLVQFDSMYKKMCSNAENSCEEFAKHFKASVAAANKGKSDPATMRKYINKIFSEYERIKQYCFVDGKPPKLQEHALGQKESCFQLHAEYSRLADIYNKTRSADFSCIDTGLEKAGYSSTNARSQVALLTLRSKEITDTVAPHRWWGIRAREIDAKKGIIMSLSSVGVCQNAPLSKDSLAQVNTHLGEFKMKDIPNQNYQTLFGASPNVIKDGGLVSSSYTFRATNWNENAGSLANCERKTLDKRAQVKLCKDLHKACKMGADICEEVVHEGGDGGDDGVNGGATTGQQSETGNGENTTPDRGGGHGTPGG